MKVIIFYLMCREINDSEADLIALFTKHLII